MTILGIETSCDETGASVIQGSFPNQPVKILSNSLASSLSKHAKTGGIIPEVAAREQLTCIIPVIQESLSSASMLPDDIDAIAVTVGPGLIGSLLVGVETAKTLSFTWKKPLIPVNHLIGHIYANFVSVNSKFNPSASLRSSIPRSLRFEELEEARIQNSKLYAKPYALNADIEFPALSLIVSGGHTDLVLLKDHQKIKWLGGTRDDAAGEAFDKIGRLIGLPYPGGSAIEKASERGDASRFTFPRPMIGSDDFDFSFSGLKTSVLRAVQTIKQLNSKTIADICASFQQAVIDVLIIKTIKAAKQYRVKSILLSGGVAANEKLRNSFLQMTNDQGLATKIFVPQKSLCTDNAIMIATAAFFHYKPISWKKITAKPDLYFA